MDQRIEIWNLLHDGDITAIAGENSETLTMMVSIPYLRRRLQPLGDSFVLTLSGLNRLEFHDFDGTASSLQETLDIGSPEIISTESDAMPVSVSTSLGQLILDFESISFAWIPVNSLSTSRLIELLTNIGMSGREGRVNDRLWPLAEVDRSKKSSYRGSA